MEDLSPKTQRGARARSSIVDASRVVFAREGFSNARIADITEEAGVSTGSFYRYFSSKTDVLIVLVRQLSEEMYASSRSPWDPSDPQSSVYGTTLSYFETYEANVDLMRVEIEVAQTDALVERIWAENRQMFYDRIARALARGQGQGVVRLDVDADLAAAALGGMVEHHAYLRFVLGRAPTLELSEAARQITLLWSAAVFLSPTAMNQ